MITRTVNVISKETKEGKKGPYMSATLSDGEKERAYPVFNAEQQKTIEQAYKNCQPIDIDLEKEGNFWNLKGVRISEGTVSPIPIGDSKPKSGTRESYGKSQDEEDWTNIRTAVMQATALATHLVPGAKTDVKGMMQDAAEIFAGMGMLKPNRSKDAS